MYIYIMCFVMEPSAGTFCRLTSCWKNSAGGSKALAVAGGGGRSHPSCEQPYMYILRTNLCALDAQLSTQVRLKRTALLHRQSKAGHKNLGK